MVAAVLVQLERHDRHPGAGKGALSYATPLLSTSQPIRAPRWRTADARGGTRKTLIVALARKLLIALWRMVTTGEVPAGVVLRAA